MMATALAQMDLAEATLRDISRKTALLPSSQQIGPPHDG